MLKCYLFFRLLNLAGPIEGYVWFLNSFYGWDSVCTCSMLSIWKVEISNKVKK